MRILVVEDERRLADTLLQLFRDAGWEADAAFDGGTGLELARAGGYDLMVLDVMLPGMDGFAVSRAIREEGSAIPILMLTARGGVADKVAGLDCGADDYMTKPFAPEELLARVRAISRRQGETAGRGLAFRDLRLDTGTRCLCCGERSVALSPKEFALMRLLLENPRRPVPKEALIAGAWEDGAAGDNSVEAYISFLRKKLAYLGSAVTISARRKVGYLLDEGETS